MPTNEFGYQALLRGYGVHLTAVLLSALGDYECCELDGEYGAAWQVLLAEYDLQAWLTEEEEPPAARFQAHGYNVDVLCSDGFDKGATRYRFHPESGDWSLLGRHVDNGISKVAPGGSGFLVEQSQSSREGMLTRIVSYVGESEKVLFERLLSPRVADRFAWTVDEKRDTLIIRVPHENQGLGTYFSYDLSCKGTECGPTVIDLQGFPLWSPDGRNIIVIGYRMFWIYSGDDNQEIAQQGVGQAPFWIDDVTYGYVRLTRGARWEVVYSSIRSETHQVAFNSGDLEVLLPEEQQPAILSIAFIMPASEPGDPWWVVAIGRPYRELEETIYIYKYDLMSDSLNLVSGSETLNAIDISEDGANLAGRIYDGKANSWKYELFDLTDGPAGSVELSELGTIPHRPYSDWSPDGEAILVLELGRLYFYDLDSGQKEDVQPPVPGCYQATWVIP